MDGYGQLIRQTDYFPDKGVTGESCENVPADVLAELTWDGKQRGTPLSKCPGRAAGPWGARCSGQYGVTRLRERPSRSRPHG